MLIAGCSSILRKNTDVIKKDINKADVVSFDVFDTLIGRKVEKPADIFNIIGNETGMIDFKTMRIAAERMTRKKCEKEEITLESIYEHWNGITDADKIRFCQLEKDCESKNSILNQKGKELFDYAMNQHKRILIISDMYLPQEFIESLLQKQGYNGYEKIYVSSQYGLRKKTGNLYKFVQEDRNIKNTCHLHIGDNVITDGIGAKMSGIKFAII